MNILTGIFIFILGVLACSSFFLVTAKIEKRNQLRREEIQEGLEKAARERSDGPVLHIVDR